MGITYSDITILQHLIPEGTLKVCFQHDFIYSQIYPCEVGWAGSIEPLGKQSARTAMSLWGSEDNSCDGGPAFWHQGWHGGGGHKIPGLNQPGISLGQYSQNFFPITCLFLQWAEASFSWILVKQCLCGHCFVLFVHLFPFVCKNLSQTPCRC